MNDKLYMTVWFFDIALLKVKNRIIPVFNDSHYIVNSICLPKSQIINERNETLVVMGLGLTAPFGSIPNRLKKGMTLMRRRYDECSNLDLIKNVTRMICVYRLNHLSEPLFNSSICAGDSGAPQHRQYGCQAVQIGVMSVYGPFNKSKCGLDMGFVRVSENIQWIRSEIMNEKFAHKIQIKELRVSLTISLTI